jgi:hypothetical protein
MSTVVRAKFRCTAEKTNRFHPTAPPARSYEFQAMYDPNQPEDQRYATATPTGNLAICVDNPAVTFAPGKSYYLDFTPAD